ncbi:hypothetical protein [Halodesulfovibrio aestuarii]|uniref:EF hand n=1 Tax=Halodesulfovibrio aestuarii TaxID=126333 RepID=A0A8G2CB82_9BACT|nr:hypothetical protein [Halodesulfovibrio aestuarii]SHJ49192.1 EF hand [Halodesulfovibrio aestuarii]
MKKILFTIALVCIFATSVSADTKFDKMDANGDASISWEEFSKTYPSMKEQAFQTIDKDNSGEISHDEWYGFMAGHNSGGKKGGGMMGGMMGGKQGKMGSGAPELIAPPEK